MACHWESSREPSSPANKSTKPCGRQPRRAQAGILPRLENNARRSGAFDFDGHLRSTLLACLRDQLTADELVAAGVTEGSGSADSENSVRLQEIFAWVIGGGWQVLVAVSATLCCSVGAAAFLTYRCFQPEANTFMGWLPIENPGSSAQAQRPARVGVKKRHLRVHEHLKAQIKGMGLRAMGFIKKYQTPKQATGEALSLPRRCSNVACVPRIPLTPFLETRAKQRRRRKRRTSGERLRGMRDPFVLGPTKRSPRR
eukprot:symbB.v1.2.006459.t2/scaffold325.1/size228936/4